MKKGADGKWHVNNLDRADNFMCKDFMEHLWFNAEGFGLGFGVWGLGFEVWGLIFGV